MTAEPKITVTPEPSRFGVWVEARADGAAPDGADVALRTFVLDGSDGRDTALAQAGARMFAAVVRWKSTE